MGSPAHVFRTPHPSRHPGGSTRVSPCRGRGGSKLDRLGAGPEKAQVVTVDILYSTNSIRKFLFTTFATSFPDSTGTFSTTSAYSKGVVM